jgi:hypothetical protein
VPYDRVRLTRSGSRSIFSFLQVAQQRNRRQPGDGACFKCGRTGHWSKECPNAGDSSDRRSGGDRDSSRYGREDHQGSRDQYRRPPGSYEDRGAYRDDRSAPVREDRAAYREDRPAYRDDRSAGRDDRAAYREDRAAYRDERQGYRDDRSSLRDDRSYRVDDRSYRVDHASYRDDYTRAPVADYAQERGYPDRRHYEHDDRSRDYTAPVDSTRDYHREPAPREPARDHRDAYGYDSAYRAEPVRDSQYSGARAAPSSAYDERDSDRRSRSHGSV